MKYLIILSLLFTGCSATDCEIGNGSRAFMGLPLYNCPNKPNKDEKKQPHFNAGDCTIPDAYEFQPESIDQYNKIVKVGKKNYLLKKRHYVGIGQDEYFETGIAYYDHIRVKVECPRWLK